MDFSLGTLGPGKGKHECKTPGLHVTVSLITSGHIRGPAEAIGHGLLTPKSVCLVLIPKVMAFGGRPLRKDSVLRVSFLNETSGALLLHLQAHSASQ